MKITKIAAAFFVGSVISFFSVANASGDYVFRTENSYNSESMNVADYSGYSHVYSFAVVSKGAMGYQMIFIMLWRAVIRRSNLQTREPSCLTL